MRIGGSCGRVDCENQNADASAPMYLSYAQDFQLSDQLESRNRTLDKINLFIIYYVGGYLCNVDIKASRQEVGDDNGDDDEHASYHWPSVEDGQRIPAASAAKTRTNCNQSDQDHTKQHKQAHALMRPKKIMRKYFRGVRQSKWKRELRFGWFPQVLLGCYFASIVYLLIAAYYQYVHDFDLLRLLKIRRRHSRWSDALAGDVLAHELPSNDPMKAQEMTIMRRMNATQATNPGPSQSTLTYRTILAECLYLVVIALTLGTHLGTYLHYRLQQPFDYHFVRNLLDRRGNNAIIKRMLERQVGKFVDSNRKYHENITRVDSSLSHRTKVVKLFPSLLSDDCLADTLRTIRKRENEVHVMVREMLSSGSLTPLFKLCSWTTRRAMFQIQFHFWLLAYSIVFCCVLVYVSFYLDGQEREAGLPSSWYFKLSCAPTLLISTPAVFLHAAVFLVVILEQDNYVARLKSMIRKCVQANTSEFLLSVSSQKLALKRSSLPSQATGCHEMGTRRLSRFGQPRLSTTSINFKYDWALDNLDEEEKCFLPPDTRAQLSQDNNRNLGASNEIDMARALDWDEHARIMNNNLIFSLLHYKIFVAQLMPLRHSLGFVNFLAFYLLFTIPIILGLHEPYLNQLNDGRLSAAEIKIFALAIGLSVLVPANSVSLPICHLSARCKDLYNDLASLMAHISEVKAHPMGKNIYDSHAESCLLKEVADARRSLDQMTVRACGLSGTYTASLKTHFWYGLLAISVLADTDSHMSPATPGIIQNQELLDVIFSDPLGVYSQLKIEL